MSAVREAWTDERLDDLANRVDRGFDRVDAKFVEVETRMERGFDRVDAELRTLRGEINERCEGIDRRFDAMQRTMIVGFASIVASVFGGFAAVAAGHLL